MHTVFSLFSEERKKCENPDEIGSSMYYVAKYAGNIFSLEWLPGSLFSCFAASKKKAGDFSKWLKNNWNKFT